ncbi:phage tail domain-containing protein [Haloactinopolyspora sp.]|uniref:phage distal tail protein n=1 Tax=Haloactinopolyspora sp. TaxID=1966353 RepID=UPI00262E5BE8|nr:phage tail domain-containing protein [Haloactinopolyspora sp.]
MTLPATAPPPLLVGQGSIGGVTFGPGTSWGVVSIEGLSLPQVRSGDTDRSLDTGQLQGLNFLGGRDVTLTLDLVATDADAALTALTELATATAVSSTEQPLWLNLTGTPLAVMCTVRKRAFPIDFKFTAALVRVTLALHATDPRLYGASSTGSVGLQLPSGGLIFPLTFPMVFGSASPSTVTVDNTGNVESRPVLTITGPVTNPVVSNTSVAGAPALTISNPLQTGYTVLAGDQLVIDMDLRTVSYYAGGVGAGNPADRRGWIAPGSSWWTLQPGVNDVEFSSGDTSLTSATLAVTSAPATIL